MSASPVTKPSKSAKAGKSSEAVLPTQPTESPDPMESSSPVAHDFDTPAGVLDATELDGLDPDVAEAWDLWSVQLGKAVASVFPTLRDELPGMTSAVICTADGLNLCSVGLEEHQVHRLAAFASSVFSLSGAAAGLVQGSVESVDPLDSITLAHGDRHTVVIAIRDLVIGSLVFALTSTDALGLTLIQLKAAADEVHALLGRDVATSPEDSQADT